MKGLVILVLTSIGGAIGWWLLERFGIFAAFMGSLVGTAAGLYYANKLSRYYLGG
jgi:hypothetical protein